MPYDEAYRKKMSESLKKRYQTEAGLAYRQRLKEQTGEKHPFYGRHHSEESKAKMRARKLGGTLSEEHKAKIAVKSKQYGIPQEVRAKMVEARKRNGTYEFSEEHRKHLGVARQRVMREHPEIMERIVKAVHSHPNRAEITLLDLLNSVDVDSWEFTGDGSLIIGGKNPDYRFKRAPLLCEMFGNYWHRDENELERIGFFEQYGYRMLVVWESELKHPEQVMERIRSFINAALDKTVVLCSTH